MSEDMNEHTPRFTMVFDGDLREFKGNPLKAITDWGPVQAAGIGDAFAENDALLARVRELEAERDAANARADEAEKENNRLRRIVASSNELCVYCGLTKASMVKCEHGFPGCPRADDINIQEAGK